jgi:hypothetical protein
VALKLKAEQDKILANIREAFTQDVCQHHNHPEPKPDLSEATHESYSDIIATRLHVMPWYSVGDLIDVLALYSLQAPPRSHCYFMAAWHTDSMPEPASFIPEQPQEKLLLIMETYAILAEAQRRLDHYKGSGNSPRRDQFLERVGEWLREYDETFAPCLYDGQWHTHRLQSFLLSEKQKLLLKIKTGLFFRDVRVFCFFSQADDLGSALRDLQRFWSAYRHLPEEDLYGYGPYHFMIHAGAPPGPTEET